MKKGSPEAKAWGAKMRRMRESKTGNRKRNKPIRATSHMKDEKRKSRKRAFHVVPDLLYAGAGYELVGPALINLYGDFKGGGIQALGNQGNIEFSIEQIKAGAIPAVELAIAGKIVSWAGKKLGLNKVGTKEVKLV